ncbi:hypothetical protein Tco_1461026, partial [Tanacetum coccineum]
IINGGYMKYIAANFSKLDKFKGMDFKSWQKKMHFFLTSMIVVYVLSTPIPDNGDDASMEQMRKSSLIFINFMDLLRNKGIL